LDTEEKMRSAGAGLGWSVIAKVYERRIAGEGEGEGEASGVGEEWEVEVAGALLEALGREECSMEVGKLSLIGFLLLANLTDLVCFVSQCIGWQLRSAYLYIDHLSPMSCSRSW